MHKLLETLHPNRWFIWAIVFIIAIFIIVWGAVERYSIEQEYNFTSDELYYSIRLQKKVLQNKAGLDISGWKTISITNNNQDLKISIPKTFSVSDPANKGGLPALFRKYLKDSADPYFGVMVTTYQNTENLSLQKWITRYVGGTTSERLENISVNNFKGLKHIDEDDEGSVYFYAWFVDILDKVIIEFDFNDNVGEGSGKDLEGSFEKMQAILGTLRK